MKHQDLGKLLRLRRQRETKAMNELASRQHQLGHAASELAAAVEAASDHERRAQDAERHRLAGLVGQELRAGQVAMLQSGFDAEADRHKHLTGLVRRAEKTCKDREAEVEIAQVEFRKRHRQAEKLLLLQTRLRAKASRRGLAFAEAAVEEIASARPTDKPAFSGDQ
jgi:hypothetical protein